MKGYSELKMLAEYATPGPWVAQHPNAGQRGSEVASGGGLNQVCADLGPSNALYIAASNPSAVLELIAELELLHDDIEQIKYESNAWKNSEEPVLVEVFYSEGDELFISSVSGQITIEQLSLIQSEMIEYIEDYFEKGSGLYIFRCSHYQAHYDNVGMTEPAHWETDLESYSEFPLESESESVVSEDHS